MSDSTASGSPEVLTLPPNPDAVMPLSTSDYRRLEETYPDLWADPDTSCLTCSKEGEFRTIDGSTECTVQCNCAEQWMLHLWMLNSGLGLAYQRLGWDHADGVNLPTMAAVQLYLNNADALTRIGHAMTLWGPPGTGKTLLLTLIQRRLMELGHDTYFCLFNQIINLHTAGWRSDEARRWFERKVMNAGALFIDDMGKENTNRGEIVGSLVDEMLRHRIQHARPTFISANLAPEVMEDRYYSGTLGLFQEVNEIVEVQGENYRSKLKNRLEEKARRGLRFPVVIK